MEGLGSQLELSRPLCGPRVALDHIILLSVFDFLQKMTQKQYFCKIKVSAKSCCFPAVRSNCIIERSVLSLFARDKGMSQQ